MKKIYVTAAELSGRFSGRPDVPLLEMMIAAATSAIKAAGLSSDDIDAVFAGAMGNFEPEGFVGPVPIRITNRLDLRHADVTPMLVGSSEAGAWALKQAHFAMRHDPHYRHILVVAGEQMNPIKGAELSLDPADQLAARQERNRAISDILDERERHYGLNMVRTGDLMMDVIRSRHGWAEGDIRELLLPLLAMQKYRRVRAYPDGHLHGVVEPILSNYRKRGPITRFFNLHDVTPTSSGAVALILSEHPRGDSLELLGMGQGLSPISLAARGGDPRQSHSIRQALLRACRDANVGLSWLRAADFALLHDAFPSIEYFFLQELGFDGGALLDRLLNGWSNPFGGLKTCGHALGASGLLQIAKAYHRVFRSRRYLTEAASAGLPDVDRCFATSVGGPLTNVVVSLLQRASPRLPAPASPDPAAELTAYEHSTAARDFAYETIRAQIPVDQALVLAKTKLVESAGFGDDTNPLLQSNPEPWIYLLERSPRSIAPPDSRSGRRLPKSFAFSLHEIPEGSLVDLRHRTIAGKGYQEAVPTGADLAMGPIIGSMNAVAGVDAASLARLRDDLVEFDR